MDRSDDRRMRRGVAIFTFGAVAVGLAVIAAGREERPLERWRRWLRSGRSTAADIKTKADEAVEVALVKTDRAANATTLVAETARTLVEGPDSAKVADARLR